MSNSEVEKIAPNLDWFLWRPILASNPPLYTQMDLKYRVTLKDVLDAHEALDLRTALDERAQQK